MSASLHGSRVQLRLVLYQPLPVLCQIELLIHILQYTLQRVRQYEGNIWIQEYRGGEGRRERREGKGGKT